MTKTTSQLLYFILKHGKCSVVMFEHGRGSVPIVIIYLVSLFFNLEWDFFNIKTLI